MEQQRSRPKHSKRARPLATPRTYDATMRGATSKLHALGLKLKKGRLPLIGLRHSSVELGLYDYPDDPVGQMRAAGTRVFSFDASAIAQELGDIRLGNTVMLGAIADHLPFPAEVLERCILKRFARKKAEVIELNRQAFAAGRAAAEQAARTAAEAG